MLNSHNTADIPSLEPNGTFDFHPETEGVRVTVSWTSKQQGIVCDLDLNAFFYDERARFYDKVDVANKRSIDQSCSLFKDEEYHHNSLMKIDFDLVNPETSAIVLFLDGGPRNFQFLQTVALECSRVYAERTLNSFLPKEEEGSKTGPLFQLAGRTRKSYQGLALCVFYKAVDWEGLSARPLWVVKSLFEPLYVSSIRDKQERCTQLVIAQVPALEKFRPRLFSSIREICAALSSHSLPKLKKKFQRTEEGLQLGQFTEVIFKQLFESHPRIAEDSEAPHAVAMLQEMFHQIDYNGDGSTDWDEFTTFCVQTGLTNVKSRSQQKVAAADQPFSLDEYVIEYGEEILHRDHILSAYRFVSQMRYVGETHKLLVIPEDSDHVLLLNEKFHLHAQLYPSKIQVIGSLTSKIDGVDEKDKKKKKKRSSDSSSHASASSAASRVMIYDCIYLSGRDMYAFSASDHSITICRELSSVNSLKVNFLQHNRFYHNLLHLKLCWSAKHDLLCSTASDRVIYGWNIDTAQIIFQITRHSDIITDFVAVDPLDLFLTCSMDKRIVLWSATSRRVKGVLLGHHRGVRSLSVFENTLLSAGFECEAKVWDLVSKDCVAVLKGHRHPIVAAKLMCERAQSEKEHRAITVDESGEFRLWNIYVRERASDPVPVPTIQIFEMQNGEPPLNQFRFLALPYHPRLSTSYYSNLIACSTKLLHFLPEKNTKEFVPCTALVCHDAGATVLAAVGKSILSYDLAVGEVDQAFPALSMQDIFSICMDGERGRRMFLGNGAGEVLLVNSISGFVIDRLHGHTKEVTCLVQRPPQPSTRTALFSCGMDGHLRVYEEAGGKLHLQNSLDNVLGEGVGLTSLKLLPTAGLLMLLSAGKTWALLNDNTLKKLLIVHESEVVTAAEVIGKTPYNSHAGSQPGTSRSYASSQQHSQQQPTLSLRENLVTLAVATGRSVALYVIDLLDLSRGVRIFDLVTDQPLYITSLLSIKCGDLQQAVNYSSLRTGGEYSLGGEQLVASTDDGKLLVWEMDQVNIEGEEKFRAHFAHQNSSRKKHRGRSKDKATPHQPSSSASHSATTARGLPNIFTRNNSSNNYNNNNGSLFLTGVDPSGSDGHHINLSNGQAPSVNSGQTPWIEGTAKELFPLAHLPRQSASSISSAPSSVSDSPDERRRSILRRLPLVPLGNTVNAARTWVAHAEAIAFLALLPSRGCFLSAAHDGFLRLWNLDADCLGEMALPNLTETMKQQAATSDPSQLGVNSSSSGGGNAGGGTKRWRFLLERLPVSQSQIDLANKIVRSLKQHSSVPTSQPLSSDRSRHFIPFGFKGFREDHSSEQHGEEQEKEHLRRAALKSLVEPIKFSEEPPPSRLPTKEEKDLIRLAFGINSHKPASPSALYTPSSSAIIAEGSSVIGTDSTVPGALVAGGALENSINLTEKTIGTALKTLKRGNSPLRPPGAGVEEEHSLRSSLLFNGDSTVCLSAFGVPSLWYVPGEKDIFGKAVGIGSRRDDRVEVPQVPVPPAFSEASIAALHREGAIDVEGHRILRSIAAKSDRVQVYERSQPTLLLRNVSMSTSASLPALDSVRKTEIAFGSQKDMYKNAEKLLKEKEKSHTMAKSIIRNAVATARVETNVRRIRSMIHLIQPPTHDEVILPKTSHSGAEGVEGVEEEGGHTEESRMQLRLLRSAAAVPQEALMRQRPLDRYSIDRWLSKVSQAMDLTQEGSGQIGSASNGTKKKKKKEVVSQAALQSLEKKLYFAIRGEFRARMAVMIKRKQAMQQRSGTASTTASATDTAMDNNPNSSGAGEPLSRASLSLDTTATFQELARVDSDDLGDEPFEAVELPVRPSSPAPISPGSPGNPPTTSSSFVAAEQSTVGDPPQTAVPPSTASTKKTVTLTTRMLLPYYKLENVTQFMDIFAKVDENFSGDLDVNEWIHLFTSLNETVSVQEARMIFMKIDKDADGYLTMRELIPVVFNKASRDQQRLIIAFTEMELTKKIVTETVPRVTTAELDMLFEAYDVDNLGFVDVAFIKDRVRGLGLTEQQLYFFFELTAEMADDDMVNVTEFKRLFKPFSATHGSHSHATNLNGPTINSRRSFSMNG